MTSMNALRYAARVLHRVVMVQFAMEKLEAGWAEGMKAAGIKAMELPGGYNSILSIVRSRSSVAPVGQHRGWVLGTFRSHASLRYRCRSKATTRPPYVRTFGWPRHGENGPVAVQAGAVPMSSCCLDE